MSLRTCVILMRLYQLRTSVGRLNNPPAATASLATPLRTPVDLIWSYRPCLLRPRRSYSADMGSRSTKPHEDQCADICAGNGYERIEMTQKQMFKAVAY